MALLFKLVVHVAGIVVAIIIRKVDVDPLNDAKYTVAIIYLSCATLVLFLVLTVFTDPYINIYTVVWSTIVAIATSVILGLTFIPKVS